MIRGTTPAGAASEEQAAQYVRGMFDRIAPRYDLLNHLLSFNIDRYWRWRTVRSVRSVLQNRDARILDVCCGTGDLTAALARKAAGNVFGSDFSHGMLIGAQRKIAQRAFEADALALPVKDASLDLVTVAFGFRNLVNYRQGIEEFRRVLRPGGTLAILEFSQPPNAGFAALYRFYSRHILPLIGGAISGSKDAYTYLPESVRKFPSAPELATEMRNAGFADASFRYLTGGIAALHLGRTGK